MDEERKINMIFSQNGEGRLTTRINIPVPWARKLGFSKEDKVANIKIENDKIIITKNKNS